MSTYKILNKEKYYLISDEIHWKLNENHLIGEENNLEYNRRQHQSFIQNIDNKAVPMDVVLQETINALKNKQRSSLLKEFYHYDPLQTLTEIQIVLHHQIEMVRDLIFEEVRKTYYPDFPSRNTSIHVIPKERSTMEFWMKQLKTSNSVIYELRLTGKLHRSILRSLNVNTISPNMIRKSAYRYWMGNLGEDAPDDICIFEGLVTITKVINEDSLST